VQVKPEALLFPHYMKVLMGVYPSRWHGTVEWYQIYAMPGYGHKRITTERAVEINIWWLSSTPLGSALVPLL